MSEPSTKPIEGNIVQITAINSDAGAQYTVQCPQCKAEISCADAPWWDTTCECGLRWRVTAIGEP